MVVCAYAELHVYDATGVTLAATLPVDNLQWSDEVGGGGACSFNAYQDHPLMVATPTLLDDCVVKVAVPLTDGGTPTEVVAFAVRSVTRDMVGVQPQVRVSGAPSLLTAWSSDAVVRPEFAGSGAVALQSTPERGFGWMSSAYDPADDPTIWDMIVESTRTVPYSWVKDGTTHFQSPKWPAGTGASWVTCVGGTGERKLYRGWLTIAADDTLIRLYFSGDEAATVWLAGEVIIETSETETGKRSVQQAERVMAAGTYAVAVDTETVVSAGGDGVDPIIVAVCTVDDDGDPASWLLVTNDATFVSVRLPSEGSGSEAPGPTSGAVLATLADEAADRVVQTWENLTYDFTADVDSDSVGWPRGVERRFQYAQDDYGRVIDALADEECDCRITPGLVLQARIFEGADVSGAVTLAAGESLLKWGQKVAPPLGTTADIHTPAGWITLADSTAVAAYGRREFGLDLGTVASVPQGRRVAALVLLEDGRPRRDDDVEFVGLPGAVPYVDFRPGDTITLVPQWGSTQTRRVLSLAGSDGSPVVWSAQLGEPNV